MGLISTKAKKKAAMKTISTCEMVEQEPIVGPKETRPDERQLFSSRLAFAFALVAAFTAILGGMLSYVVWNIQFDRYVRSNLQSIAATIASSSAFAYAQYGGWNFYSFSMIPQVGAQSDVAVQILDSNNHVIYDEASLRSHMQLMNSQQSTLPSSTAGANTISKNSNPKGEVVTHTITLDGKKIGTVRVWAYGSTALLTDRDLELRSASLAALAVAALLAIVVSSVAGTLYSRKVSRPISKITAAAQAIRKGNLSARAELEGEDEIALLGNTFDQMADSMQADRELERRLTSDVAHELRTPLMAIQVTVEGMQDGILPADAHHLGTIGHETRRLSRLTNAILELSRLENGSLPFTFAPIDLNSPVRAALDAQSSLIDLGSLKLETDLRDNLTVSGDIDRLQQAVGNLLSNAARYTLEGGIISVRTYAEEDQAVVEVSDTGMGISEENLEKLFRRFWRADDARARQTGGVGVGLSIAKEIVDRHSGCIEVSSIEGEGTTFKIKIPRIS